MERKLAAGQTGGWPVGSNFAGWPADCQGPGIDGRLSGRSPACLRVHRIYFVEEPASLLDLFRSYAFIECEKEREGETEREAAGCGWPVGWLPGSMLGWLLIWVSKWLAGRRAVS